MESSLFDFFREVMLAREEGATPRPGDRRDGYPPADADEARERRQFAMKLQQYTGPVHAKGLEDTSFYRYNLLLSLNEVGGDPDRFGRSVAEFHDANLRRLRERPWEMIATATHDTKLGEDVRARINVLSELPDEWAREAGVWMRLNRNYRTVVDGEPAPDHNDEYRFYQALIGIWPAELRGPIRLAPRDIIERLQSYMIKSVKEAKLHTSWLTPNQDYEAAVTSFVEAALTDPRFLEAFLPFQWRVAISGMINSLAQVTLKAGSPGAADFYQGSELWDLSLVDPDNRRPVDFEQRRRMLTDVDRLLSMDADGRAPAIAERLAAWQDGGIKLAVTAAGLRLRRERPELFLSGEYLPLVTEATVGASLVAFARTRGDEVVLFVAPRFSATLIDDQHPMPVGVDRWKTTRVLLPPSMAKRTFQHVLTGATITPVMTDSQAWVFAGQLFETVPVGMLVGV
jgi:(1->4)-alpha-D-glucan 1-alpha-D-glucosylmutase